MPRYFQELQVVVQPREEAVDVAVGVREAVPAEEVVHAELRVRNVEHREIRVAGPENFRPSRARRGSSTWGQAVRNRSASIA